MWNYVLSGVAYPERAALNMGADFQCQVDITQIGLAASLSVGLYKGQITVAVKSAKEVSDWLTLKNVVSDVVGMLVDGAALHVVIGFDIEIRSMHCIQTGGTRVFGADVPGLSLADHETFQADLTSLYATASAEPLFRRALGDFKRAIRYPIDTGFFCYRAVESLVNFVKIERGSANKPAAIADLEVMLSIHVDCIQFLRRLGGDVRHGKLAEISSEERLCAIKIAREILRRFAECLQTRPGPAPTFSLFELR